MISRTDLDILSHSRDEKTISKPNKYGIKLNQNM